MFHAAPACYKTTFELNGGVSMTSGDEATPIEGLLNGPELAESFQNDRFKHFLDHIPVAIAVAELQPSERLTYANHAFERLTGQAADEIRGKAWTAVPSIAAVAERLKGSGDHVEDYIGEVEIAPGRGPTPVDVWSTVIQGDDGTAMFRLVAAAETRNREHRELGELMERIREKDMLLRELQHRVTNNLQMITALIRLEARNLPDDAADDPFARLAGRVNSLAVLYRLLSEDMGNESVDLGAYLSQIAAAIMEAHAVEGVRLDLQVDSWPVSINVAMPTGLVVNELLTNALKHGFAGRDRGTITLHGLVDDDGCRLVVADDGVGLADGANWPQQGKLGALIVRSLQQNAKAQIDIASTPGKGVRATIHFARADAAPDVA